MINVKVVYLLTNDANGYHNAYRSTDQGQSFQLESKSSRLYDPSGRCYVMGIYQDKINPQNVW